MGDAFKCKNCGTVVETLQSCPSCGEAAMQPIQSSGDSDVVSEPDESPAGATDSDDSSETETEPTDSDTPAKTGSDSAATADPDTASARSRDPPDRGRRTDSGLLAWLKSLF